MRDRKPGNSRNERGATIIELLVALVVMAIGILAVSQLFPAGTRGQQKDKMMTAATLFAQEKVETLRGLDWNDANLTVGTHGPDSVGTSNQYAVSYVVATLPSPMEQVKRVDVTVNYTFLTQRSVTATTYLRR